MDKNYNFNVELAKEYGVDAAIMLQNLMFWIDKNRANEKNYTQGRYWTYNSVKAFQELFPFWTARQISRILNSLVEKNIIQKGNFNKKKYDRTLWYSLVDEVKFLGEHKRVEPIDQTVNSISPNGQMDMTKPSNAIDQKVEPIPYNKPDINKDNKPNINSIAIAHQVIDYLNLKANKNYKSIDTNFKNINARIREGATIQECKHVVDVKVAEWLNNEKMNKYLRPSTLFSKNHFEDYKNEQLPKTKDQIFQEKIQRESEQADIDQRKSFEKAGLEYPLKERERNTQLEVVE